MTELETYGEPILCPDCGGNGYVLGPGINPTLGQTEYPCSTCDGNGTIGIRITHDGPCQYTGGRCACGRLELPTAT